eukprot:CFRG7018T1
MDGINSTQNGLTANMKEQIANIKEVEKRLKTVEVPEDIFKNNESAKQDIVRMIIQYLGDEGYVGSKLVLQDEANAKTAERRSFNSQVKKLKRSILEGSWFEVEDILKRQNFKSRRCFLFMVYKQQYLEQLEQREYQKAYTLMTRKLKPLEHFALPGEFRELCYLLTCSSLQESPSYKTWESASAARERLVEQFEKLLDVENVQPEDAEVPPNRLLDLLRQAIAYQIEFSRYQPKIVPKIESLLNDFSSFLLPNAVKLSLKGHTANVKTCEFVGDDGDFLASGSSDNTVHLWNTETGACEIVWEGHTSRIWDISSTTNGKFIASASADSTVKIWNVEKAISDNADGSGGGTDVQTLSGHSGDVYSCAIHPGQTHVASGGYDRTVKLFDVRTGQCIRSFAEHDLLVSSVTFNPHGNLIVSGSKDASVRFWDINSGLCVRTVLGHMGEVTSVGLNPAGSNMLVASKDNSNRLWDTRMVRPIRRFRGHQNTTKNFIRCSFGPGPHMVTGGSEDGTISIWDVNTGSTLQQLSAHTGTVYEARWNARQSRLASCGDDGLVNIWWYDLNKPIHIGAHT